MERDKFLTEAMGECWHTWAYNSPGDQTHCDKCGKDCGHDGDIYLCLGNTNFSTWAGFGKLAIFVNKAHGEGSVCDLIVSSLPMDDGFPDRFADKYFKEKQRLNRSKS